MIRCLAIILMTNLFCNQSDAKIDPEDFIVGKFGLYFYKSGEMIKPDEYYFFEAIENTEKGLKESALKNFRKAASYGNTFGTYYTGLMYLQDENRMKGYAWLTMANVKGFIFKDKIDELLWKLDNQMSEGELNQAKQYNEELNSVYGVKATFERRLKWSRNFRLAGTRIKGHVPTGIQVQTDHFDQSKGGLINPKVTSLYMKKQIKEFVYEYPMDYRLEHGNVILNEFKLIENQD